ncbi:MAG: hypothetical protein QXZ17_11325 [Nitrososphaerota archaeon]
MRAKMVITIGVKAGWILFKYFTRFIVHSVLPIIQNPLITKKLGVILPSAVTNYRVKILCLTYIFGALVDDLLTYFFVKLWKIYAETNPVIVFFWMNTPFWIWFLGDLTGLLIAFLASIIYQKLSDHLISKSCPNRLLVFMRKNWLCPLYMATFIRCLPAIHNTLLVLFNIETPLTEFISKISSSFPYNYQIE